MHSRQASAGGSPACHRRINSVINAFQMEVAADESGRKAINGLTMTRPPAPVRSPQRQRRGAVPVSATRKKVKLSPLFRRKWSCKCPWTEGCHPHRSDRRRGGGGLYPVRAPLPDPKRLPGGFITIHAVHGDDRPLEGAQGIVPSQGVCSWKTRVRARRPDAALGIVDHFRRRFARFKLHAHLLDLRCLFFKTGSEGLYFFLLLRNRGLKVAL